MDINIKRTPAEERSIFRMKKGLDIRKAIYRYWFYLRWALFLLYLIRMI
jgi:hypothetical protein